MHEPLPYRATAATDANPPKQHVIYRDYETRSVVSLKAAGLHRYAANPHTEVVCAAIAVDDAPVQIWLPGDPTPTEVIEAAGNASWRACAHNDAFETEIERHILAPRFGWPEIPLERHSCTQSRCLAAGLPARLSDVADALELANRKDKAGERLMQQMSKPRRPRKGEDPTKIYWFDDPERLQRLGVYNAQDVETERELDLRVPQLPPSEQSLWVLNCKINARGFCVDRAFAEAARRIAQAAAPEIDAELADLTGGAVTGINQVARLLEWLQPRGYDGKSLDRKALERQLEKEELDRRCGGCSSSDSAEPRRRSRK